MSEPTLSPREAAARVGVPISTFSRWLTEQDLFDRPIAYRLGGRWRVFPDALEDIEHGRLAMRRRNARSTV